MKKKILVTEDTEEILQNLLEFLGMDGYEVFEARNGVEALAVLQTVTPDLIITDLLMNEMTGYELIKELKKQERFNKIPILVFSAKPLDETLTLEVIGADKYVLKPCPPEVLLEQVHELLGWATDLK